MKKKGLLILVALMTLLLLFSCSKEETKSSSAAPAKVETTTASESSEVTKKDLINQVEEIAYDAITSIDTSPENTESLVALTSLTGLEEVILPEVEDKLSIGEQFPELSFTLLNGETKTINSYFDEGKEVIFLNFFATWCQPCMSELPFIQEAYEIYNDRIEIISINADSYETKEDIQAVVDALGLTFPVGMDTDDIFFGKTTYNAIPLTIVIDKFGNIALMHNTPFFSTEDVTNTIEYFLSEDYTESETLRFIPSKKVDIEQLSDEELKSILDIEDERITFNDVSKNNIWPMVAGEFEGKSVLKTVNTNRDSASLLSFNVDAKAGETLAINFNLGLLSPYFYIEIVIDGEIVDYFMSERDWFVYLHQFDSDGIKEVEIYTVRTYTEDDFETPFYIDSIRILSEEESTNKLANYDIPKPNGEFGYKINNESVKKITIYHDSLLYSESMANHGFFLIDEPYIDISFYFDEHPSKYMMQSSTYGAFPMDYLYQNNEYRCIVSGWENYGSYYEMIGVTDITNYDTQYQLYFFLYEEDIDRFLKEAFRGQTVEWEIAENQEIGYIDLENEDLMADYNIKIVDQEGNPVEGVMLQVCDDILCQVYVSDAEGYCTFSLEPNIYDLHILNVPEGYSIDALKGESITYMFGGTIEMEVIKNN